MLRAAPPVIVDAMTPTYDVIVVGARCAGSSTAMLLARRGHRVLLVDRMTFPSDTASTHLVHAPGVDALRRWGLLEQLAATGCPPIDRYTFDFGPMVLSGSPGTAYCPRRTVLDKLLVDAAADAGAEVREACTVDQVLLDDDGRVTGVRAHGAGGRTVTESARVVVGADGKHSRVAAAVGAPSYNERPAVEGASYAYWSGVATDGFELHVRPGRAMAAMPTHDEQTLVLAAWPTAELDAVRADVEGNFAKTLELVPDLDERVRAGARQSRFHTVSDLPGLLRTPYGPGWALVGDAGYTTDPSTAQGISDAFLDAERLTGALCDALCGRQSFDDAMADCHRQRDERVTAMYELTSELATQEPLPPELAQLLTAAAASQEAMDAFAEMFAGVLPVPAFFAPEHVERILRAAA
jgi:2-polyprenyl-6-methoxyphenol hydroxylase-like FAD-dependent oxidoreductase